MTRSHPAVATWLLQRFIGPERESFVGDLREQYSRGRSRFWYWRQTLMAIAVGTFTAVGNDRSLPVRAILAGLCTKVWFTFTARFIFPFVHWPAHLNWTAWAAWRPEVGVIPCIILAVSGVGASRSLYSTPRSPGVPKPGSVGPRTLCWAAAWLAWTIAIARFTHTDWIGFQALTQTASIGIGGLLTPLGAPRDDHKLTTIGL
jgi:hypothetical protein